MLFPRELLYREVLSEYMQKNLGVLEKKWSLEWTITDSPFNFVKMGCYCQCKIHNFVNLGLLQIWIAHEINLFYSSLLLKIKKNKMLYWSTPGDIFGSETTLS